MRHNQLFPVNYFAVIRPLLSLTRLMAIAVVFIFNVNLSHAQWTALSIDTENDLNVVQCLDANNILVAGQDLLFKSTNGGSTWTNFDVLDSQGNTLFCESLLDIHFFDANVGIGVGFFSLGNQEVIVRTTNGGVSWSVVSIYEGGAYPRYLEDIEFFNSTTGIAVGTNGRILRTTNAGVTWTSISSPVSDDLSSVDFYNTTHGIAVGDHVIVTTTNGGTSWTWQTSVPYAVYGVKQLNSTVAYAVGDAIYKSTNGGSTWTQQLFGLGGKDVAIANVDSALVAGNGVLKTVSGGAYWGPQFLVPTEQFNDVEYVPGNISIAYAVGENGLIYKTITGGEALPQFDVGITEIQNISAAECEDNYPVNVTLKNYGLSTLTSATIHWSKNGIEQDPFEWSGSLGTQQTSSFITIDSVAIGLEEVTITSWASNPNNQADAFALNDEVSITEASLRLHGSYTIGGVDPDYVTLSAAIGALNGYGVCGEVEFLLRDGTYSGTNNMQLWPGGNEGETAIFRSESGNNTAVILTGSNIININGSKNVFFEDLTFQNGSNASVSIYGDAQNITFTNCRILAPTGATTAANSGIVISGTSQPDFITIDDCYFQNGYYGISAIGTNGNLSTGIEIKNCDFVNQANSGIYITYSNSPNVHNNTFNNTATSSNTNGIYMSSVQDSVKIFQNQILLTAGAGINLNIGNTNGQYPVRVYNNMIRAGVSGQTYAGPAMKCNGVYKAEICNNTLAHFGSSTFLVAFDIGAPDTVNEYHNKVLSNIIYSESGVCINVSTNSLVFIDEYNSKLFDQFGNNAYYTPNVNLGSVASTNLIGLDGFKTYWGDSTSVYANPQFSSSSDLHIYPNINNYLLNGTGLPVSFVNLDFDGNSRSVTPDIGADEFSTSNLDAALLGYNQSAVICTEDTDLALRVINFGTQNITSLQFTTTVDGVVQGPISWSGLILPGDTSNYVSIFNNTLISGSHTFSTTISSLNGSSDLVTLNNTTSATLSASGVSGSYTIGGTSPDFVTIQSAINSINSSGICGPVVFNIRPGTYTEQISMGAINGASNFNTITFQAENGDSSSVNIQFNGSGTTNGYVWKINNADFIKIKKLTVQALNTSSHALWYTGGNDFVEVSNCSIKCVLPGSQNYSGINMTGIVENKNNLFANNRFEGGGSGIRCSSTTNFKYGWYNRVINNVFVNQLKEGIYMFQEVHPIIKGNIVTNSSPYGASTSSAINISAYVSVEIINNRVDGKFPSGVSLINSGCGTWQPTLITGNMIRIRGASLSSGLNIAGSSLNNASEGSIILHNTVLVVDSTSLQFPPEAFTISYNKNIINANNIFVTTGQGYAAEMYITGDYSFSDHNIYFTNGPKLLHYAGTNGFYDDLASFQLDSQHEDHSVELFPSFISIEDPHLLNDYLANQTGTSAFANYAIPDLENNLRNSPPDIGADEFSLNFISNDVGILAIQNPMPMCAGETTLFATIRSYSLNPLTQATINWSVNDEVQPATAWTGNLLSNQTAEVAIGSYDFETQHQYEIKVWTTLPNGVVDPNTINDTLSSWGLQTALSGGIAVGIGTFYPTSASLRSDLYLYGLCGPTEANYLPGTYKGMYLTPIPGNSEINTLTLQSMLGDANGVLIQDDNAAPINSIGTFHFDGEHYLILKNLGIEGEFNYSNSVVLEGSGFLLLEGNEMEDLDLSGPSILEMTNNVITGHTSCGSFDEILFSENEVTSPNCFSYSGLGDVKILSNYFANSGSSSSGTRAIWIQSDCTIDISGNWFYGRWADFIRFNAVDCPQDGLISNNVFIRTIGGNSAIYLSGSNVNIYHNTIFWNASGPLTFYGSGYRLMNNMLYNTPSGSFMYIQNETTMEACDYNNYGTSSATLTFNYDGVIYNSFAAYQAASNLDTNSTTLDPQFLSTSDVHVQNSALIGSGTSGTGILTDYDGYTRDLVTPTLGAFEPLQEEVEAGDLSGDGTVDITDILMFFQDMGCVGADCAGDFNNDGVTNIIDLIILFSLFG